MSFGMLRPNDEWQAKMNECSKAGLIYLVELLQFLYQVPREQMLQYATDAKKSGEFENRMSAFARRRADPELDEIRRLEKRAKALKAKRQRKEKA